jgi:4-hydroxy-tetrahydrodipicolinate synthase
MKTPPFVGSGVALVTPFTENGINFQSLGESIDFQIANGTAAIICNGTTGEASTQSIPEHLENIDFTVKRCKGKIPVIAGTGSNDTADAIHLSKEAERLGADALLVVTPYYNKTSQHGLLAHFGAVADSVNIPVIVYNVPSRTGMCIQPDTYKELAKHPRIVGTKEASGDIGLIAKTKALCPDDFYIWSGNDNEIIPTLALGGKGIISVAANIIPREISDLTSLFFAGKQSEALAIQLKYMDLIEKLFIEVNPVPIKTAMNILSMNAGVLRMPLVDLTPANREKLIASMKAVKLL